MLLLGDSITQGGPSGNGTPVPMASYRDPLIRLLNGQNVGGANPQNRSYPVTMVGSMSTTAGDPPSPENSAFPDSLQLAPTHEGHYGWRADEILTGDSTPVLGSGTGSLATWLGGYTPDVAFIHLGTNDAINDTFFTTPDPNFANTTWNEIADIVLALRADNPDVRVFIARLIPTRNAVAEVQTRVAALNVAISANAPAIGATVVDLSGLDQSSMLIDAYHPNVAGEEYVGVRVFAALKSTLDRLFAPVVTSPTSAAATVGSSFSYQITGTESPTSYSANGLPPGLTLGSGGLISGTPTTAGTFVASVSASNTYGAGDALDVSFVVAKGAATVSLSNLAHTYDGSPKSATVTTSPSGLAVNVTYGGSASAPTNAGSYVVSATVNDSNYVGSTSGTLTIAKASQSITFASPGNKTFGDASFALSASSSSGLPVAFALVGGPATLTGNTVSLTGAGIVTIRASQAGNANVLPAASVERTFTVAAASATVTLSGLSTTYDGSPRSVSATTVPQGLPVSISYGGSSTPPTNAGSYPVSATIESPDYNGSASGTLVVAKATQAITFPAPPARAFGDAPFALSASASSGLAVGFVVLDGPATISGNLVTLTGAGEVRIRASQGGSADIEPAAPVDRSFAVAKAAATVSVDGLVHKYDGSAKSATTTTVPAGLAVTVTYNGSTTLPTEKGTYAVSATVVDANYSGSATGTLSIGAGSQLVNLSSRALVGAGDGIMIPGFVVGGSGTKSVLIRGLGPLLGGFGVTGFLETPRMRIVNDQGAEVAVNQGWSTAPNAALIESESARVGAEPLPAGSGDCAVLLDLPPGGYTVQLAGVNNTTGVGLVEIYDLDEVGSSARLVNISSRSNVGVGADILIPGYVISGDVPRKLLVRASGPTIAADPFFVSGVLADPTLTIYTTNDEGQSVEVAKNNDWGTNADLAELAAATAVVGAFEQLAGSKDAAIVVTLAPGVYTVQVSGVGGTTGVALVEIYEIEE
ncbi:hypothetical protein ASA1KI_38980 [Opitutales bacterium ASA1]|nr:hypothetical protein ASA1KI_38980 [Opitutales bacterium ASA1]